MKKNVLKVIVSTTIIICLLCFGKNEVVAQCNYIVITSSNDTTTFSITNDFPIRLITNDSVADDANYSNTILQWKNNNLVISNLDLPTFITQGVKKIYFEISEKDFLQFSDERKEAIRLQPSLYIIK